MTTYLDRVALISALDPRGRSAYASMFGEQQVAAPFSLLDHYHKYNIDSDIWYTVTAGSGTVAHNATSSAARLTVTAADGDRALLRTHTYFRYQAGRGLRIVLSQIQQSLAAGTLYIVRRTSTSGVVVDNASEISYTQILSNATDTDNLSDGIRQTADRRFTVDLTKGNIFRIELQWLGVGDADIFIDDILLARIANTNQLVVPYMRTAVLPITHEIINVGSTQYRRWGYFDDNDGIFFEYRQSRAAGSMDNICSSVAIQGGEAPPATSFGARNTVDIATTTTERPLLAIRPAATLNSIVNRIIALPKHMRISTEGFRAGWRLLLNPTALTGGAWAAVGGTSAMEVNITATAFTGGQLVTAGFLPNSNDKDAIDLFDLFKFLGRHLRLIGASNVPDTLLVTGVNESGGGTTQMRAAIAWEEIK